MFRLIILSIVFVTLTTSCSKEKDIVQENIVGTWKQIGKDGSTTLFANKYAPAPDWLGAENSELRLSANNTFTATANGKLVSYGTYKVQNKELIFYADSLSPCLDPYSGCDDGNDYYGYYSPSHGKSFTLESVTTNKFTMRGESDPNYFTPSGDGELYCYKRK